ncbi:M57 family metalloprotease [Nocardioides sp. C4-1]|uniref:M57 family metalloprotease n=1 Tax=Nocardioides sp. C4-1 TaxID=3151851 RepID=UPI003267616D
MKHTRPITVAIAGGAACAALLASPAAQGAPDPGAVKPGADVPTYAEFREATYRDFDGQYIVNGDEPIDAEELRAYYNRMVSTADGESAHGEDAQGPINGLIVNQDGGADDVWTAGEVGNLTYCVSDDFGSMKSTVVAAMADGAAEWEAASSAIDFVYDSSADADCVTSNDDVLFPVEPVNTSSYIARAFFPSSPDYERNVLVADSLTTSGWDPANIMAHELGHVLGFRHEHTRPEAGTCFEDNNWRPLTPYDAASIMHYPQCNGASQDLTMSATDRSGVADLYGG